jgi:deazaflavin-dependent oxidoreductase (nitroreductase family)
MNGNVVISWLLRSPLHGMLSDGMMLITVTGRKTGKKYTTPVGYFRENGNLWILTSRDRTWWKNLQGGAEVELLLNGKLVFAFSKPELDVKTIETQMYKYIEHTPRAAKSLGIHIKHGNPNMEDITRITKDRLFVRVTPH